MNFDELDISILKENFNEETLNKIDMENVSNIFMYLNNNGIYYSKDLFITAFNLFLLPYEDFVKRFEYLKKQLGENYIELLSEDISLLDLMYSL